MKHRIYHREELDTPDEIVAEFQKLRDEVIGLEDEMNIRLAKLANNKKGKKT